ncbi:MAG: hypothetical protein RLZ98_1128 [Pseudomonadota bacterium]|jgi:hypothetical protein
MSAVTFKATFARGKSLAQDHLVILWLFASTLLLSALLLFSVQPIFAKMVLPKLGGSPSVWAVSMCFFQAVLLAGYCYAHALNRYLSATRAAFVHIPLLCIALLALPFGLPQGSEPPAGDAYLWLVGVLTIGVGLPFFAISANAPLLQAWFARSGHPQASDPYFLYGASNLGSLVALLGYPVLIEPFFGLTSQAGHWTTTFVLLALMIALCAAVMRVAAPEKAAAMPSFSSMTDGDALTWRQRLAWIGLAFVPSGLLVAFTSYLTTDIASAPFLWVVPLALFLATFVLVFRDEPFIPHSWLLAAQPVVVALTLVGLSIGGSRGWMIGVTVGFCAFFVTTMVCHRELFNIRPASRHLTEFYMWMSLGGVLGGIFTALIAPQIFNAVYEYPLLLVLGMMCRPGLAAALRDCKERRETAVASGLVGGFIVLLAIGIAVGALSGLVTRLSVQLVILTGTLLMLVAWKYPLRQLAFAMSMGLAIAILPSALNKGFSERSFFGVHRVMIAENGAVRLLMHGTTLHGAQRLKDKDGNPVEAPLPATYYYPGSPMAKGVEFARQVSGKTAGGLNVGSVGLGAGSIACYSRPSESWRFYEIDPVVVKLASDPKLFSFLSRCRPGADIVVGDARLTLAKEPDQKFDYLIIDAFSSDSVPVHLLTREAIAMYLSKLRPDGILALHISNRHMDLVAVAGATAHAVPGTHAALADDVPKVQNFDQSASHVMFITKSKKALEPILASKNVTAMGAPKVAPWTDDFSDIVGAIWRTYKKK